MEYKMPGSPGIFFSAVTDSRQNPWGFGEFGEFGESGESGES